MKKLVNILAIPLLAACSSTPESPGITDKVVNALDISPFLNPYRIDVRQGNFVTQDMVAQLKPGLSKDQVRFILGTPLLTDIFHADRWDYIYRLQTGAGAVEQRRLAVFFADGKLARVDGDVTAATAAKPAARVIEIKAPPKPEEAGATAPSPSEPKP